VSARPRHRLVRDVTLGPCRGSSRTGRAGVEAASGPRCGHGSEDSSAHLIADSDGTPPESARARRGPQPGDEDVATPVRVAGDEIVCE
jgi:hypothetical protein